MEKKINKKNDRLLIALLALLTFFTRFVNLLKIPIFTDEAIYIRWAQIGLADRAQWFISLTDGKQPLLTWLMYPFLSLKIDPLFAGRIVLVFAGSLSSIAIYLIGKNLFGKRTGILSFVIYLISPFTMVYDRLALMDSLIACCILWSLYLQIVFIKKLDWKSAILTGIAAGIGLLTKTNAMFALYLLPLHILFFLGKKKDFIRKVKVWLPMVLLIFFIGQAMYNSLRISPWFYIVKLKNYSFILTFKEFISSPFRLFWPNLNGLWGWLLGYVTLPVLVLIILGLIFGLLNKRREILFLFVWFIFPFVSLAFFGRVIFPRFILFMTVPLFVIAGFALNYFFGRIRNNFIPFIISAVFLTYPFYQSLVLIVNPVYANIPTTDRNQLFDDWPSGYGVKEVVSFLENKSKTEKVVIGTEGTFGLFPAVFEIYLQNNPNVEIHGFWPVNEVPPLLIEKAKTTPTYLVFKDTQKVPTAWPLKLISKQRRGIGNTYLLFYQVIPE